VHPDGALPGRTADVKDTDGRSSCRAQALRPSAAGPLLALLAIAPLAGCALPAWMHHAPIFPAASGEWELPLYEPLQRTGPYVLATVSGQPPPEGAPAREEVLLYVDSGLPRVHARLPVVPPRPFKYLFGCTDAEGDLRRSPLWVEIAVWRAAPNADVEAPFSPETPPALRRLWAQGCARLALLDANPIVGGPAPRNDAAAAAEARVVIDTRHVTFK
jgi:hypothetical protein